MIQAAKLGSAKRITAVIPLFPYARQDRKAKPREPITARLVADMLQVAGADRILTMDLHAGQIQGFFTIPVDHMTALPLFARHFRDLGLHGEGVVSVSPDTGRAKQAERFAEMIEAEFAIMHKTRPAHDVATVTEVAGRVRGKRAIIGDDVIMTGGTMLANVRALEEHGATEVWLFATHGVFCGDILEQFAADDGIKGIVVTDTVPIDPLARPEQADRAAGLGPPRRDDHERLRRRLGLGDLRRREPALLTRTAQPSGWAVLRTVSGSSAMLEPREGRSAHGRLGSRKRHPTRPHARPLRERPAGAVAHDRSPLRLHPGRRSDLRNPTAVFGGSRAHPPSVRLIASRRGSRRRARSRSALQPCG